MEKRKAKYNMWQMTAYMLRRAFRGHKDIIIICLLIAIIDTALTTTQMLVTPVILSRVELHSSIWELVGAVGLFTLLLFILAGFKGYFREKAIVSWPILRVEMLMDLASKRANTSYCNFCDEKFQNLGSTAEREVMSDNSSTQAVWRVLADILNNVLGLIIYLIIVSSLNPLLVLVTTVLTVIEFLINKKIGEAEYYYKDEISRYQKESFYLYGRLINRQFAKDLRIFGIHEWLCDVRDIVYRSIRSLKIKKERKLFLANVVGLIATLLRNGIAYAYLIRLLLKTDLSAAVFLLYLGAISGFTAWITGLLRSFLELHKKSIGLSMLREFLEWPEPYKFDDGEALNLNENSKIKIELKNVSYRYPGSEKDIISNMNLTLEPGENVAIVGLNGAGKTTLVRLITGLLDPTEGEVCLNGEDIRKYNRNDYYRLFSAVFQDFSVLESTVFQNVSQTIDGYDEKKVRYCLEQAGLTDKVDSLPEGADTIIGRQVFDNGVVLSGGETQRLILARALYKNGPVLVLDEPTAALDPIAENDIYMKYNEMTKGKTSIFISHRLASTRFCNRILLLENGRVKEEGTHYELISQGGDYAHLFEVQSRYYKEGGEYEYENEIPEVI